MTEPLLFFIGRETWLKLDQDALKLESSCLAESCLGVLLAVYFIFNVNYPTELKLVYGFFERLIGLKEAMRTSSIKVDELYWSLLIE
jgi:hypothetical protein